MDFIVNLINQFEIRNVSVSLAFISSIISILVLIYVNIKQKRLSQRIIDEMKKNSINEAERKEIDDRFKKLIHEYDSYKQEHSLKMEFQKELRKLNKKIVEEQENLFKNITPTNGLISRKIIEYYLNSTIKSARNNFEISSSNSERNNIGVEEQLQAKQQQNSIVGIIACKKARSNLEGHSLSFLGLGLINIAIIVYHWIMSIPLTGLILLDLEQNMFIILFVYNILLLLNKKIFDFRVSTGLYGTNESEVREVLECILQTSNDIDGDNLKKLKVFDSKEEFEKFFPAIKEFDKREAEV